MISGMVRATAKRCPIMALCSVQGCPVVIIGAETGLCCPRHAAMRAARAKRKALRHARNQGRK